MAASDPAQVQPGLSTNSTNRYSQQKGIEDQDLHLARVTPGNSKRELVQVTLVKARDTQTRWDTPLWQIFFVRDSTIQELPPSASHQIREREEVGSKKSTLASLEKRHKHYVSDFDGSQLDSAPR